MDVRHAKASLETNVKIFVSQIVFFGKDHDLLNVMQNEEV